MGEFKYENQGTKTYLVYQIGDDDTIDSLSLGMLTNNSIQGLAPAVFTQMDEDRFIKYDITSKVSVQQVFAAAVNKKRLLGVLNGIVDAVQSAEEYMIDINSLVLDLNYMFSDVSTCNTVLVCLPVVCEGENKTDYGKFIKNIMVNTPFDQTESCDYVATVLNYLNSAPVFSFAEFKNLLSRIEKKGSNAPQQKQKTSRQKQQEKPAPPVSGRADRIVPPGSGGVKPDLPTPSGESNIPETKGRVTNLGMTPRPVHQPIQEPSASGEKVSLFHVMAHFNKENWEQYKSQKGGNKKGSKKSSEKKETAKPSNNPKIKQEPAEKPQGFEIPGKDNNILTPAPRHEPAREQVKETAKPDKPKTPQKPNTDVKSTVKEGPVITQPTNTTPYGNTQGQKPTGGFGDTTVLNGGGTAGETTVLSEYTPAKPAPAPHLIRVKNRNRINIDKPVFRIGKERSYVDCFIGDNPAISRSHADIINRDGHLFIMDINSTNHTYVNGELVPSNGEREIIDGDIIRLANEEFEFHSF